MNTELADRNLIFPYEYSNTKYEYEFEYIHEYIHHIFSRPNVIFY